LYRLAKVDIVVRYALLSLMEESSTWLIFLFFGDRLKRSLEMGSTLCCF
jgi:hypothetical protein